MILAWLATYVSWKRSSHLAYVLSTPSMKSVMSLHDSHPSVITFQQWAQFTRDGPRPSNPNPDYPASSNGHEPKASLRKEVEGLYHGIARPNRFAPQGAPSTTNEERYRDSFENNLIPAAGWLESFTVNFSFILIYPAGLLLLITYCRPCLRRTRPRTPLQTLPPLHGLHPHIMHRTPLRNGKPRIEGSIEVK